MPGRYTSDAQLGSALDAARASGAYVHAGKIDVCDYHDYNAETQAMPDALRLRVDQCARMGKQLVVTESGIQSWRGDRCALFSAKMAAARRLDVSGYVSWGSGIGAGTTDGFGIGPFDCRGEILAAARSYKGLP